jgi:hypothetical protein
VIQDKVENKNIPDSSQLSWHMRRDKMFKKYLTEILAAKYEDRILVYDFDDIESRINYTNLLLNMGFYIVSYKDATDFRYNYETQIRNSNAKYVVVVNEEKYIPYDILQAFYCVNISWDTLFPKINREILINNKNLELPLIYSAHSSIYETPTNEDISKYVIKRAYDIENIEKYLQDLKRELLELISESDVNYNTWIMIASKKGKAEYLAAQSGVSIDLSFVEEAFQRFMLSGYRTISGIVNKNSPIMVSRVLDFIGNNNEKVALIVLDGMSVFDFNILSAKFRGIEYQESFIYAMVPTTTAISRQSLLAGKFPVELERPFNLSREEKEFFLKAKSMGYSDNQICFARGYDPQIGPSVKFLSVILNDIDDLVHGQLQGRIGMYNDVNLLAKSGEIQCLVSRLYNMGFKVYLTSDHGNTVCKGLGTVKGTGVEVETKSKRMLIVKDFANYKELIQKNNLLHYPGYYNHKQYKYLICNTGTSFDNKDKMVVTHGGISIDEVIVPFIKVKAANYG